MKKAIFTIAAKNYLPHARTLGDSIKKIHSDIDFYILLSDEIDGKIDMQKEMHTIVEFKSIEKEIYKDLAFKYDVLEFSTSVKPFFIDHLFNNLGYEKVIYLDPDIYVFNSINYVYDLLDSNFMVVTPHFTRLDLEDSGVISEETILFVGIYNLGFVGLAKTPQGLQIVDWWKRRLYDKCFVDKENALHVDQKWIDLIPSYFDSGVHVSRYTGLNISHCNMHQRKLTKVNDCYMVDEKPLIFFHYTGFDPKNPASITKPGRQTKVTIDHYPEYKDIFFGYAEKLFENGFEKTSQLDYYYSKFEDGTGIFAFQRRLYRRLRQEGQKFTDPFSVESGTFFTLLEKNKLVINEKSQGLGAFSSKDVYNVQGKKKFLEKGFLLLKKILGIKKYSMLLKVLFKYSQFENQTFLINKHNK